MSLLTLPPEILAIIFKDFDIYTFNDLYNTCKHLRNVISQGMVKECHVFDVGTLKTSFFRDISSHLRVLNLSEVAELDGQSLIEALKDAKNLNDLDVRETDIIIPDLLEIVKVTSLKNIAIDFSFGKKDSEWKLSEEELLQYQEAFQGFRNVHFSGDTLTMLKKMALCMLEKADLCDLTLTCSSTGADLDDDWSKLDLQREAKMLKFLKFEAHIDDEYSFVAIELPIFNTNINTYEIFIFGYDYETGKQIINATPLVKKRIIEMLQKEGIDCSVLKFECLTELPRPQRHSGSELQIILRNWMFEKNYVQEIFIICWDKERTTFDSKFNAKLLSIYVERSKKYECLNDSDSDFGFYYHDYDDYDNFYNGSNQEEYY